jgi:hypothetical protein
VATVVTGRTYSGRYVGDPRASRVAFPGSDSGRVGRDEVPPSSANIVRGDRRLSPATAGRGATQIRAVAGDGPAASSSRAITLRWATRR